MPFIDTIACGDVPMILAKAPQASGCIGGILKVNDAFAAGPCRAFWLTAGDTYNGLCNPPENPEPRLR